MSQNRPENLPYNDPLEEFSNSPQYEQQPSKPHFYSQNQAKNRRHSGNGFRTQPIKKMNRRKRYLRSNEQPLSPMNTTQFILNQGYGDENFENFLELNNYGNFGSMLGLINEECLNKSPNHEKHKEDDNEIDTILKISRMENDHNVLLDSIEKLAKIIKEKQEKIEELEKNMKEEEKIETEQRKS